MTEPRYSPGVRRLVLAAAVVACLGVGVEAASPTTPKLDRIALRATQVGPGYKLFTRADSRCLEGKACATLDLCSSSFPSEKLRTARLQVGYSRKGKTSLSNEVVTYRPGGAKQALREVTQAALHCPKGPIAVAGAPVKLRLKVERISDPHLLPGYLAVRVRFTGNLNGVTQIATAIGVYQFKGDVFSGVYTDGTGTIAAQQRLALHAAEQSAANLKATA